MSDTNESIDAILAEIRDFCSGWSEDTDVTVKVGLIYGWMCRIEAAAKNTENAFGMALAIEDGLHKRDKQSAPGNAAAMRAALEWIQGFGYVVDGEFRFPDTNMVKQQVDAALAKPARNCDVGTTEEQAERFIEFCKGHLCDTCPVRRVKRCGVGWSQLPFAPTEGGKE